MNINKIQAAADKNNEIKAIDHMMQQIDQLANLIVNREVKTHWEFKVEDLVSIEKEASKIHIDDDGEMRKGGPIQEVHVPGIWNKIFAPFDAQGQSQPVSKHVHQLKGEFKITLTMQILSVIMGDMMVRRQKLISELIELGYEL